MSAPLTCFFCDKTRGEVERIITGRRAAICNECIGLCVEIMAEPAAPLHPQTSTWVGYNFASTVDCARPQVDGPPAVR